MSLYCIAVFCVVCFFRVFFTFVASFPSVLWYCWLGLLSWNNPLPYKLYCVGGDVKHCSISQSMWRNEYAVIEPRDFIDDITNWRAIHTFGGEKNGELRRTVHDIMAVLYVCQCENSGNWLRSICSPDNSAVAGLNYYSIWSETDKTMRSLRFLPVTSLLTYLFSWMMPTYVTKYWKNKTAWLHHKAQTGWATKLLIVETT